MDSFIIGISGKKQSGKNTMCDCLYALFSKRYSPDDVAIFSFADALKQKVCKDVLGLTEEQVNGSDEQKNSSTIYKWENLPDGINKKYAKRGNSEWEEYHDKTLVGKSPYIYKTGFMTAREIMQIVGTDIFRNYFDDAIWVNATLREIKRSNAKVVLISDVRFRSEVISIVSENGYVIRLLRDVCETDSHPSETALDSFDFEYENCIVLDNRKMSIEQQNAETVSIFEEYFKK